MLYFRLHLLSGYVNTAYEVTTYGGLEICILLLLLLKLKLSQGSVATY